MKDESNDPESPHTLEFTVTVPSKNTDNLQGKKDREQENQDFRGMMESAEAVWKAQRDQENAQKKEDKNKALNNAIFKLLEVYRGETLEGAVLSNLGKDIADLVIKNRRENRKK